MERYFSTSMALFAFCLTAGTQFGPLIAGYVIEAKGWRWFFIVCSIIIAFNLVLMIFFLPETNYKRDLFDGETAAEADKQACEIAEHLEHSGEKGVEAAAIERVPARIRQQNESYAGTYWKDLVRFRNRGLQDGMGAWLKQFSLPFRFIVIPHVFFAMASFGVFLGG